MEVRKLTIVSTRDQKRTTIETNATTLAELKSALNNAGISYDGMTFYEALTRTELLNNDSLLPHDVSYKGTVTNELVFMLTNSNKKIKSGALSAARVALYDDIISGDWASAVNEMFGKNFTNCSNAELASFLESVAQPTSAGCVDMKAREAILKLISTLWEEDYLCTSVYNQIKNFLTSTEEQLSSSYSDAEIDELINGIAE